MPLGCINDMIQSHMFVKVMILSDALDVLEDLWCRDIAEMSAIDWMIILHTRTTATSLG